MKKGKSEVYFLPWREKKHLAKLIRCLRFRDHIHEGDFVAIKLHFGEKRNTGYIKPKFVIPFVQSVRKLKALPFLTDTNIIYRKPRFNAVEHLMTASGHGFKLEKCGAPIIIADGLSGKNYVNVNVNKKHFKRVKIAGDIYYSQSVICLSHVTGHLLGGFAAALKNMGMGCAARSGKYEMHNSATPTVASKLCQACGVCIDSCPGGALSLVRNRIQLNRHKCIGCCECIHCCPMKVFDIPWDKPAKAVNERFVEYALGATRGKPVIYFNFINHFTEICDCLNQAQKPIIPDIGILASMDPVAIDQASYDLISQTGKSNIFDEIYPGIGEPHQLKYAESMGLGTRDYEITRIG